MIEEMREFASRGGRGFWCIPTDRGNLLVWIDEIKACATDEELTNLIVRKYNDRR